MLSLKLGRDSNEDPKHALAFIDLFFIFGPNPTGRVSLTTASPRACPQKGRQMGTRASPPRSECRAAWPKLDVFFMLDKEAHLECRSPFV